MAACIHFYFPEYIQKYNNNNSDKKNELNLSYLFLVRSVYLYCMVFAHTYIRSTFSSSFFLFTSSIILGFFLFLFVHSSFRLFFLSYYLFCSYSIRFCRLRFPGIQVCVAKLCCCFFLLLLLFFLLFFFFFFIHHRLQFIFLLFFSLLFFFPTIFFFLFVSFLRFFCVNIESTRHTFSYGISASHSPFVHCQESRQQQQPRMCRRSSIVELYSISFYFKCMR